jgi:hypothetical protein
VQQKHLPSNAVCCGCHGWRTSSTAWRVKESAYDFIASLVLLNNGVISKEIRKKKKGCGVLQHKKMACMSSNQ